MTERIAIVGSRAHPNPEMVREFVRSLPKDTIVISGGAEGVDTIAVHEAQARGMETVEYPPDDVHDLPVNRRMSARDKNFLRNTIIVVACDRLAAFPDGSKGGTFDTIEQARRFGRPYLIKHADGREKEG